MIGFSQRLFDCGEKNDITTLERQGTVLSGPEIHILFRINTANTPERANAPECIVSAIAKCATFCRPIANVGVSIPIPIPIPTNWIADCQPQGGRGRGG